MSDNLLGQEVEFILEQLKSGQTKEQVIDSVVRTFGEKRYHALEIVGDVYCDWQEQIAKRNIDITIREEKEAFIKKRISDGWYQESIVKALSETFTGNNSGDAELVNDLFVDNDWTEEDLEYIL